MARDGGLVPRKFRDSLVRCTREGVSWDVGRMIPNRRPRLKRAIPNMYGIEATGSRSDSPDCIPPYGTKIRSRSLNKNPTANPSHIAPSNPSRWIPDQRSGAPPTRFPSPLFTPAGGEPRPDGGVWYTAVAPPRQAPAQVSPCTKTSAKSCSAMQNYREKGSRALAVSSPPRRAHQRPARQRPRPPIRLLQHKIGVEIKSNRIGVVTASRGGSETTDGVVLLRIPTMAARW
jgi:hypothetical protein